MRDFVNYGSSIDIKVLIFTLLFILIWKFIIEKKNKNEGTSYTLKQNNTFYPTFNVNNKCVNFLISELL